MSELVYRVGRHTKKILIPLTPEPKVILELWCRRAGGTFEVTSRVPEEKPIKETYVCRFPAGSSVHISGRGYRIGRPERVTIRGMYGQLTLDHAFDINMLEIEGEFKDTPSYDCKFSFTQPPRFSFECNVTLVTEVVFEYDRVAKKIKVSTK